MDTYNWDRPHDVLDLQTPQEFLETKGFKIRASQSHMYCSWTRLASCGNKIYTEYIHINAVNMNKYRLLSSGLLLHNDF